METAAGSSSSLNMFESKNKLFDLLTCALFDSSSIVYNNNPEFVAM